MEYVAHLQNADIMRNSDVVLGDVNLSLSKAEFVYLIGKTGSGKSSLLKTLWGELPLMRGRGYIAGFDLASLRKSQVTDLRRNLGIVFQEFHLFEEWTVQDNLVFVLEATGWKDKQKREERVMQVLNDVELSRYLDKKAVHLSGGEQQRLGTARAMLNQPQIIIADEPTGNLDPETSVEILHLLRDLAVRYNTAILMATHDYRTIERFPGRVYLCEDNQVRELD